jgi:uncharacterized repeat protein (TIGR01451 family)
MIPGLGRADPVRVTAGQFPGAEPPPADGLVPAVPGVPGLAREAVDPPVPAVAIRVRVPSSATPGRELEYRLLVENVSQADAHHVTVRVPVPSNARYKTARPEPATPAAGGTLSWPLGTLKGRERREIVLVVEPAGGDDVVCCARVSFEHGQCVRTRVAKPSLRVRTSGPERAPLYDIPSFVIEVTNTGAADAKDVVLTEELPPGLAFSESNPSATGDSVLTWKLGNLAPGERRRVELKVIAKENGTHPLKATVSAAGIKAVEGNLSRVLVGEPKLTLVKTGPRWRSLDRTATYFLTVSNPGSMPATNVQLSDELYFNERLRSGIELVGASDGGRLAGNDVRWSLGTLAPGARKTVSLTLRALQPGDFKNAATVRADRDLSAPASATTTFETPAGLTLDVEKASDPVAVGKSTTFTFRVRQRGAAAASKVGLSVTLPEELQVTDARGQSAGTQEGRTVTFAPLGELAPNVDAVYTVTVRAERAGEATVKASVTAEPLPKGGAVQREESTIIVPESASPPPRLAPEKANGK